MPLFVGTASHCQATTPDRPSRTFSLNADSCIFNDAAGARNCFAGTATFLSTESPHGPGFFGTIQRLRSEDVTFGGPGFDLGGPAYGWSVQQGEYRRVTSYRRGITQNLNLLTRCRRVGDCANYFYMEQDGGVSANADEAVEALGLQANETAAAYVGKLLRTTGTGDERPILSHEGELYVIDGGTLLDITRGTFEGELDGKTAQMGGFLVQLGLTAASLPLTDAWGTIAAGFEKKPTLANVSAPVIVDVTLGTLPGRRNTFVPGVVCVAGPERFEQAVLTLPPPGVALPAAATGHQTLLLQVRYPNANATGEGGRVRSPMLFQGGVCGQYVSADADLKFSGRRTTYPAFGSFTGSDLITGKQVGAFVSPWLPQPGHQAWTQSGPDSRFHLYPGAEIVANDGPGAETTPQLEPNRVEWAAGDRIESPHYMTVGQNVLFVVDQQSSPTDLSYGGSGIKVTLAGKGMAGFHKGISVGNAEDASSYLAFGGPLLPPSATYFEGQFNDIVRSVNAPYGALVSVTSCNPAGGFLLFDLPALKTDHKARVGYSCDTGAITIPRLTVADAQVTGTLRRGAADVCTEDGAHCPQTSPGLLRGAVSVPALAAGTCTTVEAALPGLKEMMTVGASARSFRGEVTTSTYIAGPGRAGLVVCAPTAASQAAVFSLSAQ